MLYFQFESWIDEVQVAFQIFSYENFADANLRETFALLLHLEFANLLGNDHRRQQPECEAEDTCSNFTFFGKYVSDCLW